MQAFMILKRSSKESQQKEFIQRVKKFIISKRLVSLLEVDYQDITNKNSKGKYDHQQHLMNDQNEGGDNGIGNIDEEWDRVMNSLETQFNMNDSDWFAQNVKTDQITNRQSILKFDEDGIRLDANGISQVIQRIIEQVIGDKEENLKYQIVIKLKGKNRYDEEVKFSTYAWDLEKFVESYFSLFKESDTKEQARNFLKVFGIDSQQQTQMYQNTLTDLRISKIILQPLSVLPKLLAPQPKSQSLLTQKSQKLSQQASLLKPQYQFDQTFKACLTLYAISRARIQYLGQNIPMFRFQHSLFEALMSAIHPDEVTPLADSNLDFTFEDLGKQHRFMKKKFIEFQEKAVFNEWYRQLLEYSAKGDTIEFVNCFNSHSENEDCSQLINSQSKPALKYRKYMLSLYDINQRKFIIHSLQKSSSQQYAYLVHYNGYVFGTSYPKLMIIRERESNQQKLEDQDEILSDEEEKSHNEMIEEQNSQSNKQKKGKKKVQFDPEELILIDSDVEIQSDVIDQIQDQKDFEKEEDELSEVEVKSSFILSSNMIKQNARKNKMLSLMVKNANGTTNGGLIAFKINFTKDNPILPDKLICYGQLSISSPHFQKLFQGQSCITQFLLWLFQTTLDYKLDARCQSRFVNLFCHSSSGSQLGWIMRGMSQIVGRDAHFIGEMNKLKIVWFENIKFYEMSNYFEGRSIQELVHNWNLEQYQDKVIKSQSDHQTQKVMIVFELSRVFISELESIPFHGGKLYDFTFHGQGSSSSLALSVFQYFYLDKQHIKGTNDLGVLEKEKYSMKTPYFFINQLAREKLPHVIDLEASTYRLYEIKNTLQQCFNDYPIPLEYNKIRDFNFEFDFESEDYDFQYKPFQFMIINPKKLQIANKTQSFKIMNTSLYKVDYLIRRKMSYSIPAVADYGLDFSCERIENTYIWGVEIINAIVSEPVSQIRKIKITEEILYLQGKVFSPFVTDILNKRKKATNQVQRDILQMILDNFHLRFTQKYSGLQQIIHINDLNLMRQTYLQSDEQISKLFEIYHPYYYIEYTPSESDQLQQIGSLLRLTSYINACHRVTQHQLIKQIALENIIYIDKEFLLLKSQWLEPHQTVSINSRNNEIGKYQIILETKMPEQLLQQDNQNDEQPNQNSWIQNYIDYFMKRHYKYLDIESEDQKDPKILRQFRKYQELTQNKNELSFVQFMRDINKNIIDLEMIAEKYFIQDLNMLKVFQNRFKIKDKHDNHQQQEIFVKNDQQNLNIDQGKQSVNNTQKVSDIYQNPQNKEKVIDELKKAIKDFELEFNKEFKMSQKGLNAETQKRLSQVMSQKYRDQEEDSKNDCSESLNGMLHEELVGLLSQSSNSQSINNSLCGKKRQGQQIQDYFSQNWSNHRV